MTIKPVHYGRDADGTIRTTFSDGTELVLDNLFLQDDGSALVSMVRAGIDNQKEPNRLRRAANTLSQRQPDFKRGGAQLFVPARPATDSGQVSAYQPARYVAPQGPIRRIQRAWEAFLGKPEPRQTTEQGASSAASPVTYYLTLWEQRFGRRARIEDTRSLYLSDPRVFQSTNMYVDAAIGSGPTIVVQGKDELSQRAQKIAKAVQKVYNPRLLKEWGKGLVIEGDLFVQHVVTARGKEKQLVAAVAMPAIGLERLTNDSDQFIAEQAAFEQIDSMTFETVAQFPASLMTHTRWSKINGDRYGTSAICTIKRLLRFLELLEQAICITRMVRAPQRLFHSVGSETNTSSPTELENYRRENAWLLGKNEPFNPMSTVLDYFGNGNTTVTAIPGDETVGQVADVEYIQNVMQSGLLTPGVFFGLGIQAAKRDILEDMKNLWLKSHLNLTSAMDEPILHGFELALTFAGIDPSDLDFHVQWPRSSLETAAETVEMTAAAKEGGLISEKTAVTTVSTIFGTIDVEDEIKAIESQQVRDQENEVQKRTAGISAKEKLLDEEPTRTRSNGKAPSNGKPTAARNN